ncbi:MAG: ATP-binding cassette domain-containing protein [Streptococcus sp.]
MVLLDHSSIVANLIRQEQDFSIFGGLAWLVALTEIGATECLELVGLSEAKNKKVKDYSLGMKQRLGLATALLANPDILILDEPINGLDPEGIRWVRNFCSLLSMKVKLS